MITSVNSAGLQDSVGYKRRWNGWDEQGCWLNRKKLDRLHLPQRFVSSTSGWAFAILALYPIHDGWCRYHDNISKVLSTTCAKD
jgi:hypothetical protein